VPPSLPALPLLRSSKTLQDFIEKLDKEYDSLNEMMAKGHNENFGTTCWAMPCDVHIPEGHLCQPFSQTWGGGNRPMQRWKMLPSCLDLKEVLRGFIHLIQNYFISANLGHLMSIDFMVQDLPSLMSVCSCVCGVCDCASTRSSRASAAELKVRFPTQILIGCL
jgi:hypothetical protein